MDNAQAEAAYSTNRISILHLILRWSPITILVIAGIVFSVTIMRGGIIGLTAWYLVQLVLPVLGGLILMAVGIYAVVKRKYSKPMILTSIVSLLALTPILLSILSFRYPANLETTEPSATVRLPANAALKVGWGGDNTDVNYHAATPDQRWAYDLLVEPYLSGSEKLEDYGCYGIPVVAPAAGTVTKMQDGAPDATPGKISNNITAPLGNHIVIQLPSETYLILAHFKPGSIAVQEGQTVEEGQLLGACGNSGNTSEPHIHIHHQRQDPAQFPVGFAEGLPLYFRDHDGPPMPEGGIKEENGKLVATGAVVQHKLKASADSLATG